MRVSACEAAVYVLVGIETPGGVITWLLAALPTYPVRFPTGARELLQPTSYLIPPPNLLFIVYHTIFPRGKSTEE
jgi:hypothetical protein